MIGIELGAPSSRVARAELAPDPHGQRGAVPAAGRDPAAPRPRRDHDGGRQERRDQAAAAADALRGRGAAASSTRSTRCSPTARAPAARTGRVVRDIATATLLRRAARDAGVRERRASLAARRSIRRAATSAWSPARAASSAGAWPQRLRRARATRCAAWCARAATPRAASDSTSRSPSATSPSAARSPAPSQGCRYVASLRRARVRLGDDGGDHARSTSRARATCSRPAAGASVERFVHFSTTDVYGYPGRRGDRRDATPRRAFATGTRRPSCAAEAEVRRVAATHGARGRDPAPGDRLRAAARTRSSARSRGRSRGGNMLLVDRGRAVAGLCYVENLIDAALLALRHDAAPGPGVQRHRRARRHLEASSPTASPRARLPQVRWSMPYWLASAHRLLARARLPRAAPDDRPAHRRRCSRARPCRCSAATRTSATARRASCSAGSRASTTPSGLRATSPG